MTQTGDVAQPVIFISYTQVDRAWAEWIAWQLDEAGYDVRVQAWHAVPSTNWAAWMHRSAGDADHTLVVLSPDALRSDYVEAEWQAAFRDDPLGRSRRLIPVLVAQCERPGLLGGFTWIDLVDLPADRARSALLSGVAQARTGAGRPPSEPPYPGAPTSLGPGNVNGRNGQNNQGGQIGVGGQIGAGGLPGTGGTGGGPGGGMPPAFPGGRPPSAESRFLTMVERACADRYPGAHIRRVTGTEPIATHLAVTWNDGGFSRLWGVGIAPDGVDDAVLDRFVDTVHRGYEERDADVESELVYGGAPAGPVLSRRARRRGVLLRSLPEFQRLWDPRGYVARQSERLERDGLYPPALYVPQRYDRLDRAGAGEGGDDVFDAVVDWLDAEEARLILVLANFGHGKTFLLRELARRLPKILPGLVPVLIELRALEKNHSLDALLAQHLAFSGEERFDIRAVRRMLDRGQLVLLFDGFDELALQVTYDRAAEHLRTIVGAVTGRAKVVLSSRTQHFASDNQWRTALGDEVDLVSGSRLVRLGPFGDGQIREFLLRQYDGDESRADARLELIRDIEDLLGLSRNPRMLSFVAALDESELRAVRAAGGGISSVDLYDGLLQRWLRFESNRRRPTLGAVPGLDVDQIRRAVTALALRMWRESAGAVDLRGLEETTRLTLTDLTAHDFDPAQAAYAIGSGSLLVRGDEDRFGFIHVSVMEYLVAVEAAKRLAGPGDGAAELLAHREMSPLMADFFCESAGREAAEAWSRAVAADPTISDVRPANAAAVGARLRLRGIRVRLAGQDLRRQDLSGLDLRFADMSGADLRGVRLRQADLTGVQLTGAMLADAVFEDVVLDRADLTGADLTGARLSRVSMRDTRVTGGRWDRAALLGGTVDEDLLAAPELAGVAVAGRDRAEVVLVPPRAGARAVAFAPSGRLVAAAWGVNVVFVEPRDGRVVRTLAGHRDQVRTLAFSPDGAVLVSAGVDGTVRVWSGVDGRPLRVLRPGAGAIQTVDLSPDGTAVALGCADGTTRILDLAPVAAPGADRTTAGAIEPVAEQVIEQATGRVIERAAGPIAAVAFSPDGTLLASAGGDLTIRLWRTADGVLVRELRGHTGWVRAVAFSPDGARLATGGFVANRVWDVETGAQLASYRGHSGGTWSMAYSPDGSVLASGGADEAVRLWRPGNEHSGSLGGHSGRVWSIAFSPDGRLLASGGADRTVQVREVATGRRWCRVSGRPDAAAAAALSPDGRLIATGAADRTIRIWETRTGRQIQALAGHAGAVGPLAFSPDATLLASGDARRDGDGRVRLWELATGAERTALPGHTEGVDTLAFRPDGTMLVTGEGDGRTRWWDVASGRELAAPRRLGRDEAGLLAAPAPASGSPGPSGLSGPTGPTGLAVSPDGRLVARARGAGPVELIALSADGAPPAVEETTLARSGVDVPAAAAGAGEARFSAVAFSPDATLLASAGPAGTVRMWQLLSGQPMVVAAPAAVGPAAVEPAAVGPTGVGPIDGESSGAARPDSAAAGGEPPGEVSALAFSPDGRVLAVGEAGGLVRLLPVAAVVAAAEGGARVGAAVIPPVPPVLAGHLGAVRFVGYSADGTMLASASADGTTRLWEPATGRLLATLLGLGDGGWALLRPDGRYRLVGEPDGALWWVIRERALAPGLVDGADPVIRRLSDDTPVPGLAHLPGVDGVGASAGPAAGPREDGAGRRAEGPGVTDPPAGGRRRWRRRQSGSR